MFPGVYLPYCLGYTAFGVDNIGDSFGVLSIRTIARAVSQPDFSIGVAQQAEGEIELPGEGQVLFNGIEADAKYFGILCSVFLDSITESFTLGRSAGSVSLWIEPQDHGFAPKIAEADVLPGVGLDCELRCNLPDFEHALIPLRRCEVRKHIAPRGERPTADAC